MREIRPSGLEGGVARKRHPYPYRLRLPAVIDRLHCCFEHLSTNASLRSVIPHSGIPEDLNNSTIQQFSLIDRLDESYMLQNLWAVYDLLCIR